jgi:excisionase family DNA binding protein
MELAAKILHTRTEAAAMLSISVSSLDMMVGRGMLRTIRKGRRVLIHKTELERVARQNIPAIWPPKKNRRTTRNSSTESLTGGDAETNGTAVRRAL